MKDDSGSQTRVKICCIGSSEEAALAIRYGADALGLVSEMPSGPGVIPEKLIGEIAAGVPPGVATFLLTCSQSADTIVAQQRRARVNTLQLCDQISRADYRTLREALPGIALVQVIHVNDEAAIAESLEVAPFVDALLLDSGNRGLAIKELGGTGRRHDWRISRRIRDSVSVPVYLAGGLKPENVVEALETVKPFGVDVCTGVRTEGRLDEVKLAAFFKSVRDGSRT